jgi:hypothetical protein
MNNITPFQYPKAILVSIFQVKRWVRITVFIWWLYRVKVPIQAVPNLAISVSLPACPGESGDMLENGWWECKSTFVKGLGPCLDESSKPLEHEGVRNVPREGLVWILFLE